MVALHHSCITTSGEGGDHSGPVLGRCHDLLGELAMVGGMPVGD